MFGSSNQLAIDIGEYSVKAMDGKWQNAANFVNKASDDIVIAKEDGLSEVEARSFAIRQSLKTIKAKNADVVTSIPISEVIMRDVIVDSSLAKRDIEGVIEGELSDSLPFTTDQVYFDYVLKPGTGNEYLVAASRRDLIDPKTSSIKAVDKTIAETPVDVDAFAYGRLMSQLYSDLFMGGKAVLLIDVGYKKSRFYFYTSEGLVYNREQQIGGFHATENVAEVYDLGMVEAEQRKYQRSSDDNFQELVVSPYVQSFFEQLSLAVDFYEASSKGDKKIAKIDFVGGGACLDGFLDKLAKQIEYPLGILDLSPVWKKEVFKDNEWLIFCAKYAHCVALLAEGEKA